MMRKNVASKSNLALVHSTQLIQRLALVQYHMYRQKKSLEFWCLAFELLSLHTVGRQYL